MFFDLNLPIDGLGDLTRREVVAMALQLGYSGVAANHMVTGVMVETDRCKIRPLELHMILSAATGVAESAKFHQRVLGVPQGLPFRQFSRITVTVETPAQANALNSANPVLKTYDLVAARPTNQKMFNLACSQLEVDLISIDFSQRLPFRLKAAMVKAAIERGIFFEVCYGRALLDVKARRELFVNAMTLQEAASGRNIIMSSGARRAGEMRGPNDVANMSTLFGLPQESAKKSISRTCESVILHGVARKKTYKAAIHVEHLPGENSSIGEDAFAVPTNWDPLSLGGASSDFIPLLGNSTKTVPNQTGYGAEEKPIQSLRAGEVCSAVHFSGLVSTTNVSSKPKFEEEMPTMGIAEDAKVKIDVAKLPLSGSAVRLAVPEKLVNQRDSLDCDIASSLLATKTLGKQTSRSCISARDVEEETGGKNKAKRRKKRR